MTSTERVEAGPRIVETFQGYAPPFNAAKAIRRMLRIVPPKFLWGLHTVVLTNAAALSRREREQRTRLGSKTGQCLGYYNEKWNGQPARITLLLDNIENARGRNWIRWGFFRDIALSEVFFHELGHHIHRVHKPKYEEKEGVANKYSAKLSSKFLRDLYWYLFPLFVPIALVVGLGKDLAKLYRRIRAKF